MLYRWTHPPLPLPPDVPALQRLVAESVHWGLYALLIVQPLVGWAATSAYRAPIIVYGLFELPPILPVNQPLSEQLFAVHRALGILMAVLVCAHVGAALYHHFVRRDRVLMRMVSGRLSDPATATAADASSFRQFVNAALTMNPAADVRADNFTVCIAWPR